MDYNTVIELFERGQFLRFGQDFMQGAAQDRNVVALLCLHSICAHYAIQEGRAVTMAFKLADEFLARANGKTEESSVQEIPADGEKEEKAQIVLERVMKVLAEQPCPICSFENGIHDNTCALGAAIEG